MNTEQSLAGILEPVFAIRTEEDLGVGDTEGVRQMVDWCARHHLNVFQTLPINETSGDNSPYNAISSLAIEPGTLAISPRLLPDLTEADYQKLAGPQMAELRRGQVQYTKVKALKLALLERAFVCFWRDHWQKETARGGEFRRFARENESWLSGYALFRLMMEQNGHECVWERWPAEHRTVDDARAWARTLPASRRGELERRELFFSYVQWIAFSQWDAVKQDASRRGVYLMGDIPFGVSRCSADVWANRDQFDLDWSGGAPPEKVFKVDAFTEKWGQNWGIPNYRWDLLRQHGFGWWRTRIGNIRRNFHFYRIDHALGFFRIYSFPWTPDRNAEFLPLDSAAAAAKTGGRLPGFKAFPDDTPEHQEANQRQGEEILRFVQEASGDTQVVAEDLGVVPPYVPVTLAKLGIPGFRIPAFFREHDGGYCDPAKYPRLSLAQPATHDHPPLAAAWAECWRQIDANNNADQNRRELREMLRFAGLPAEEPPRDFTPEFHEGYMRRVAFSKSWLAVVMITDVFGQTARFNTPGAVSGANWTTRMDSTVSQLDKDAALSAKTESFSRVMQEAGRRIVAA